MMDKVSHNLYAELMLREAARNNLPETGSSEAVKQLTNYLAGIGVPAGDWKLDDGSGLSRNDLVTPRLLTQVLSRMASPPFRDAWMPLLPVGGDDGTLEHRLCCMANARGIRAKTGMLDRSQTLSGYAESKAHGTLVFSVMLNNFSVPEATARGWVDKIAEALLE